MDISENTSLYHATRWPVPLSSPHTACVNTDYSWITASRRRKQSTTTNDKNSSVPSK